MDVSSGSSTTTRVKLPPGVVRPFEVFLNGVRNDGGADSNFGALVESTVILGGKYTF